MLPRDLISGLAWASSVLFLVEAGDTNPRSPLLGELGEILEVSLDDLPWKTLSAFDAAGVVTFSERMVLPASRIAERLGLRAPSVTTAELLTDKSAQRRALRAAGVEHIRFAILGSANDWQESVAAVSFPLVLKPTRGAESAGTVLVLSQEHGAEVCSEHFARHPTVNLVAEEYLEGSHCEPFADYVSVETVCYGGRVVHLGVTGKLPLSPPFRETGQFVPSACRPDQVEEILRLTDQAVRALDVSNAVLHTEIKLTPAGPRIIEVNGRIGGYLNELYSRALGVDLIELVTRASCGQTVELPVIPEGRVWFQYTHQPPIDAESLVSSDGSREVLRSPQVTRYDRLVLPGTTLPRDGRTVDLDLLCGHAESLEDLIPTLTAIQGELRFGFDSASGYREMGAGSLVPAVGVTDTSAADSERR